MNRVDIAPKAQGAENAEAGSPALVAGLCGPQGRSVFEGAECALRCYSSDDRRRVQAP